MSYDIVYARQFIRCSKGVIPLVLIGPSNCYTPTFKGRERRVREWAPLFHDPVMTEEALMQTVESCCGKQYQEHFKWHSKWVDDKGFRSFIRNGIRDAMSIEDILSASRMDALYCKLTIWTKSDSHCYEDLSRAVHTSQELEDWLDSAKQYHDARHESESIFFDMHFMTDQPLKIHKPSATSGAVVAMNKNGYIRAVTPTSISMSPDPNDALVFASQADAYAQIPSYFHRRLRFVNAENIKRRKTWYYVIRAESGTHAGRYVQRLTRKYLRFCFEPKEAHHFPSKHAAEKYITQTLTPRLSSLCFTVQIDKERMAS